MPMLLVPVHESNDCHNPAGPGGGQFCSREYGSHKTLGRTIDAVLAAAEQRGVRLPGRVAVSAGKGNRAAGMYSASNDLLWISPRAMAHLKRVKPGALADPSFAGIINHELGHMEHARAVGDRYDNVRNAYFPADLKDEIRQSVSRYATTNGLEFVAEVYAGRATGREYSEAIMRFYKLLGGVVR
jgi:hypothetical protein